MVTLQADGLQAILDTLGVEGFFKSFHSPNVLFKPLDIYRSHLANILVQLTKCEPQMAYDSIQEPNDFGDLEVVTPRLRVKGSNPEELALELAQNFPETSLFDEPFEDGIHLRLLMSPQSLARIVLPYIVHRDTYYGSNVSPSVADRGVPHGAERRVIVEFSSPNLGKEFDGTHLRSTLLGSSIASLYNALGWDVCRLNFLGDWGKHIGLLAVGWSRFGSDELLEIDPLRHLLDVYTKINLLLKAEEKATTASKPESEKDSRVIFRESVPISAEQDDFFKRMEGGDSDAVALWKRFREICVTKYADLYGQLGIIFDEYSGESEVSQSTIAEVEASLIKKGVYEDNEGARIVDFKKHGSKGLGTLTARHANGTTSYLLRDVGAVLERRKKYDFDKMIYVVSAKQDMHFKQLIRTLELMGDEYLEIAQKLQHVNFGNIQGLLKQPGSSGLLLSDILEQRRGAAPDNPKTDANDSSLPKDKIDGDGDRILHDPNEIARLALMSQVLSTKRSNTLNFTFGTYENTVTPVNESSGLRLQQWLDKLRSRVQDAEIGRILHNQDLDYSLFEQELAYADMLRLIARFPNIVEHSFEKLEPSSILVYLLQVMETLPSVWDVDKDDTGLVETGVEHEDTGEGSASRMGASQTHKALILVLYDCIRTVLENGMNMIGLIPIEKRDLESTKGELVAITALSKELNEDATTSATPQATEEKMTIQTAPHGENEAASSIITSQEIDEEPVCATIPREVNEAMPTATSQGTNEGAALSASSEEDGREVSTAPIPQEAVEDVADTVPPQEVSEKERHGPSSVEHLPDEVVVSFDTNILTEHRRQAGLA